MIFAEAVGCLKGLGESAALLPGLTIALVLFGLSSPRRLLGARRRAPGEASMRDASPDSAAVLGRIASGVTILVSFLVAASVAFPPVTAADLLNLLGIGGVAFRDVFQNLLAATLILLTRPFVISNQTRAGSHEGTVEDAGYAPGCCASTTTSGC